MENQKNDDAHYPRASTAKCIYLQLELHGSPTKQKEIFSIMTQLIRLDSQRKYIK